MLKDGLFSLHMNESEHPMKSIAAKGCPQAALLSNKTPECSAADSYMDPYRGPQDRFLHIPIKQRTIAILVRSSPWRRGWRVECQKNRRDKRSLANTITGRK